MNNDNKLLAKFGAPTNEEMLSLYDFLGRAAGPPLGKEVYAAAKAQKVSMEVRNIQNPKYTGTILMYPRNFLISFFTGKAI